MTQEERFGVEEAKARARQVHGNKEAIGQMVEAMLADAGRASRQVAWVLTHLSKEDIPLLTLHREQLMHLSMLTADPSLHRLSLSLLERMEWTPDDVRADFLDHCLLYLSAPDAPYGVRSLCIKLAYLQCRHYDELGHELRTTLLMLDPATLGAGVKNTWQHTLARLAKKHTLQNSTLAQS